MSNCDAFVFIDDVQFSKNSFINRNKIKTSNGSQWLTVPIKQSGKFGQLIKDTEVNNPHFHSTKIKKTIISNYSKTQNFSVLYPELEIILSKNPETIVNLNIEIIEWICEKLNILTEFHLCSHLNEIQGNNTKRLVSIVKSLNGNIYYSGFGGIKYQEQSIFSENNISVKISDFQHPIYDQLWGEFIPNLSIIDYIFNEELKKCIEFFKKKRNAHA
ncbi:WbqC family protein [candidate division KSB1 bacterium]